MSDQPAEQPEQNIEADQVVVNNAEDGGGVDNQAEPTESDSESNDSESPASEDSES